MQLTRLKIRGLGDLPQTCWIPIDRRVTIFRASNASRARHLLRAIQTINPPYACEREQPFSNYPTEIATDDGHRKRVHPCKRTIALAVFSAAPSLTAELGAITDILYETDRIEVGRKLDYSRWINFVELASSTRWSEVSGDIHRLLAHVSRSSPPQQTITSLIGGMKDTDRIRGETMKLLDTWLTDARTRLAGGKCIDSTIEKIRRASLFADARRIVEDRMPLFLSPGMAEVPGAAAGHHRRGSGATDRFAPILLLDLLDDSDTDVNHLLDDVHRPSSPNQHLCFVREGCLLKPRFARVAVDENEILAAGAPAVRRTS